MCHNMLWTTFFLGLLSGVAWGQTREERLRDFRMPGDLVPYHYDIDVRPEVLNETGRGFVADSQIEVNFEVRRETDVIIMNAIGYTIGPSNVQLTVDPDSGRRPPVPEITTTSMNSTEQFLYINLASSLEVGGQYRLRFTYTLPLRTRRIGLYRVRYGGRRNRRWVVTTAFRPSGARYAFPCFDEPEYKATFDVTIQRPPGFNSISSMNVLRQQGRPGEWIADIYQRSFNMSPHSLSMTSTEFVTREIVSQSGVVVRLWADRGQIGRMQLAARIAHRLIDYFEEYTNMSFPIEKLDHISIPGGGGFGARDALGVLTYPNNQLQFNTGQYTSVDVLRIAATICQQTAVQYFGHIVSASWWSDAWVNEALITYFHYRPLEYIFGWKASELEFLYTQTPIMETDALNTTQPVRRVVDRPSRAGQAFGTNPNLKRYLNKYEAGIASTDDFWAVLQEQVAADNIREPGSGELLNIKDKFDPWIKQSGYPVISYSRPSNLGGAAQLNQTIWHNPRGQQRTEPSPWNYRWNVPVTFFHAGLPTKDTNTDVWLNRQDGVQTSNGLPAAGNYAVVNVDRNGYYRVHYDDEARGLILADLDTGNSKIPTQSKAELIEDAFEEAQAGFEIETKALDFIKFIGNEPHNVIWTSVNRQTAYMDFQLSRQPWFSNFERFYRSRVDPIYANYSLDRPDGIRETRISMRFLGAQVMQIACAYGNPTCVSRAQESYSDWMNNPRRGLHPDTELMTMCTAVEHGGEDEWDFLSVFVGGGQDRVRALGALSCTTNVTLMQRYFDYCLNRTLPQAGFRYIARTDLGRPIVWSYLQENWNTTGFIKFQLLQDIASSIYDQSEIDQLNAHISRYPPTNEREANSYTLAQLTTLYNQDWHSTNREPVRQWLEANQPAEPVLFTKSGTSSSAQLYHHFNRVDTEKIRSAFNHYYEEESATEYDYE